MNKVGLLESDIKTIINLIKKDEAIEEAIIFGSRAKGNYKNGSDVDIALKGTNLTCDNISFLSYQMNEETIMPYRFDIFNYHSINNKELIQHIDRVGLTLYRKNSC